MPLAILAQEEIVHSVYFDFDKHELKEDQKNTALKFIMALDTTMVESISIYGYTDDRGKDDYNFVLSTKRANTIREKLIEQGIKESFLFHVVYIHVFYLI